MARINSKTGSVGSNARGRHQRVEARHLAGSVRASRSRVDAHVADPAGSAIGAVTDSATADLDSPPPGGLLKAVSSSVPAAARS